MRLEGIHHITAITAEAQQNVDFYAGVLGLRLVKKSVNQDDTSVYHLFYADETGDPGSDITFFEYPGLPRGRAGAGMVHQIVWRLTGPEAVDFWERRLADHGTEVARHPDSVVFADPEGLTHELRVVETSDAPLIANHPEIPSELALQGFHAARAYAVDPTRSRALLEDVLGFTPPIKVGPGGKIESRELRGSRRGNYYLYEPPPPEGPLQGAGTVHHIAWGAQPEEIEAWRQRVAQAGAHPTPVIDRHYFRSVYFREPSGVLFEIATIGPGFTVDEPVEHLGEKLSLTPQYEHLRDQIEPKLTPLCSPRRELDRA
ncbi:MAG: VOC family protein [Actinomycetota bacterium]|nr:VOC family protein [Actinomycetota bacterium]